MSDEQALDRIIEYSIDGGHVWHHGRIIPAWVVAPDQAEALAAQRAVVRDRAKQQHGQVNRVTTRILSLDDPRAEINHVALTKVARPQVAS
ncbi:MAG TPA: hypothetical protein VMZ00_09085 [Sporichthya sp.]|nr:hypothetical protein [Sporichthya sp.]